MHYYRAGSAASRLTPAYLDRLPIAGARLVHLSGTTPALSADCAATFAALFERARAAGVVCSFDVNHRPALWAPADAAATLLSLAWQADIVFVGLDEAQRVWGVTTPDQVRDLLGASGVVVKNADVGATLFESRSDSGTFVPTERVEVVEPVGAGDAFAAGYLSAWLRGDPPSERLRLGHRVAAFALGSVEDHADATSLRRTEEITT